MGEGREPELRIQRGGKLYRDRGKNKGRERTEESKQKGRRKKS